MINQKQLENVEYFNYLGSMITNDASCTHEIKSRISMENSVFKKEEEEAEEEEEEEEMKMKKKKTLSPANWT
jgi:hypothetical protein